MSCYELRARNKANGEILNLSALDDFFGKHRYGYRPYDEHGIVLTEEQFNKKYEVIDG